MRTPITKFVSCWLASAAFIVTGCDKAEPVSYQIPKEDRSVDLPTAPAATEPVADTTPKMQVLPGMQQAADDAGEITYTVPEGWVEVPASGIRKADFNITDGAGAANVTVLTFPGDVGGTLANINRWRGQVGLATTAEEDLPKITNTYSIAKHSGLFVRIEGDTQSILGGILPFHGSTWFFKMQGDTATVLAQEAAMKQFLDSIGMAAHAH